MKNDHINVTCLDETNIKELIGVNLKFKKENKTQVIFQEAVVILIIIIIIIIIKCLQIIIVISQNSNIIDIHYWGINED